MATKINVNTLNLQTDLKEMKDDIDESIRKIGLISYSYEELSVDWKGDAATISRSIQAKNN